MTRAARGSIAGSNAPRADNRPNMRGALTVEQDLKVGTKLWLAAWSEANLRRELHLDQRRGRHARRPAQEADHYGAHIMTGDSGHQV
jgi:hypothetical protein